MTGYFQEAAPEIAVFITQANAFDSTPDYRALSIGYALFTVNWRPVSGHLYAETDNAGQQHHWHQTAHR
jgi:hypothetical protein